MNRPSVIKIHDPSDKVKGKVIIRCFRDGLLTKYADLKVVEQNVADDGVFVAGVRLIITLQGKTELHFADKRMLLNAEKRPVAALLPISKSVLGSKKFAAQSEQKELVIFIEPRWLKNSGFSQTEDYSYLSAIQQAHLQPMTLFVNKRVLTLVKSIIANEGALMLHQLQQECDCLALIAELLSQLPAFKHPPDFPSEQKRSVQLVQLLLSGKADNWTLSKIAKYMHTNVTTLQKNFKQMQGCSIMNYLRQAKLEKAYKALLDGASVSQAAEVAGYINPDNFTTAFRRYFGSVPSKVKKEQFLPFIG